MTWSLLANTGTTWQPNDHWYGGKFPTEENLAKIDMGKCPNGIPLKEMLRETHQALYKQKSNK